MKAIMFQGTGSNVGKSLVVAGLCRAAWRRGLRVRPFKPQNMSNNAAVTWDGGEIGRAQALQALASGVEPSIDMNPVLLKPESDKGAAVIVQGKHLLTCKARDYAALKPKLMNAVLESFERLKATADLVIVEGAGSPAEVNLRAGDIANMGFATAANVPVVLIGDVDRGGVIAQMAGSKMVLAPQDEAHIKGFVINKFRGDASLFQEGYELISTLTGWQGLGVLPYFEGANALPAEDALDLRIKRKNGKIKIAALRLSRIANFDDFDPLAAEAEVDFHLIEAGEALPGDAELVIIPGTKSTIADLQFIEAEGWDIDLRAHHRRGGKILGICGGYQILGQTIDDLEGFEGASGKVAGLGLLDVTTKMTAQKTLTRVKASHMATKTQFDAYEIHIGRSEGDDCARPFALINGRHEGAISCDGLVEGTYLHGLFADDGFRAAYLANLGGVSNLHYRENVETMLDALAQHIEKYLDVDAILALAR